MTKLDLGIKDRQVTKSFRVADLQPKERRAVEVLAVADSGLTKSALAQRVWGEITPSTQSMATRLTRELCEAGWIEEAKDGRQVIVRLTGPAAKARRVVASRDHVSEEHPVEKLREFPAASPERLAMDRPYVHLEQAARVAGLDLRDDDASDRAFARVLLTLLDTSGNEIHDARRDAEAIKHIVREWPAKPAAEPRIALSLVLTQFGKEWEREYLATEVLAAYRGIEEMSPGARLLWVAAAAAVARRLKLLRHERADADHDRILARVKKTLRTLDGTFPAHARYFRAITSISDGRLRSEPWIPLAKLLSPEGTLSGPPLKRSVQEDARSLAQDARFNATLAEANAVMERRLFPEIVRRAGLAPRFLPWEGALPLAAEQWGVENQARVVEAAHSARKALTQPEREILKRLAGEDPGAAGFQVAQAKFLLDGSPPEKPEPREYDRLLRNNYWTGVQLWTDIAMCGMT